MSHVRWILTRQKVALKIFEDDSSRSWERTTWWYDGTKFWFVIKIFRTYTPYLRVFKAKRKKKFKRYLHISFNYFFSLSLCEMFECLDDIIFLLLLYDVMQWLGINHRLGYSNQHTLVCNRIRIYIGIYTIVQYSIVHWRREGEGEGEEKKCSTLFLLCTYKRLSQ